MFSYFNFLILAKPNTLSSNTMSEPNPYLHSCVEQIARNNNVLASLGLLPPSSNAHPPKPSKASTKKEVKKIIPVRHSPWIKNRCTARHFLHPKINLQRSPQLLQSCKILIKSDSLEKSTSYMLAEEVDDSKNEEYEDKQEEEEEEEASQ